VRACESGQGNELSPDARPEREHFACIEAVLAALGPEVTDCTLDVLELCRIPELRRQPIVQADYGITVGSEGTLKNGAEVGLVACRHSSSVDVDRNGKRLIRREVRDVEIELLAVAVLQSPLHGGG
jgi:hypothetical protein